ncbi:carbohydrate kinase family protein [Acetatifactor aquisgranensis]|uniref:carbohydrate kinase family protein n=1 Tax=Acetatifactor aquisgranensis TaxID=2941233 RepID=UPI0020404466|nr:carbohydrate kinase family protein [Acetatifactor aquisgranensis]
MKVMISGLVNIETTLQVRKFPIDYYPIDYPFFGIASDVSGVAYNVAKALSALGDGIRLASYVGEDEEGRRILARLEAEGIGTGLIRREPGQTPVTVALHDGQGRRQIYCDLKDIQEKAMDPGGMEKEIRESDLIVLCNTNFNRLLLGAAKRAGKPVATDVHVLSDIRDPYNKEFMEAADILFLSHEGLPCGPERFLCQLKEAYPAGIIVIGLGGEGAMLYERSGDRICRLEAVPVGEAVNTLGAGDALFSAFIHYYGKGCPAVEALVRAEVFAALKIRHNGGAKGFVGEEALEEYRRGLDLAPVWLPADLP